MSHRLQQRGFTLIEVTITLAVVALMMAITIPAFSNLGVANLHSTARQIGGFVRSSYDAAALSGQTHRMVFDPKANLVSSEATAQVLNFDPESNALIEAVREGDKASKSSFGELLDDLASHDAEVEEQLAGEDDQGPGNLLGAMFGGINALADAGGMAGSESFTTEGKKLPLGDAYIADLTIAGKKQDRPTDKTYLYFFPHGYTQEAVIHLAVGEGADVVYVTIWVEALTGEVRIRPGYVEAKT